jgi:hypothetical protein
MGCGSGFAPWFASVRQAQDELVSSYSADQLATLADFFERFTVIWEQERQKLQQVTSVKG